MATNWQEIATKLYEALESFMAYDGSGKGGAEDGNRGNWHEAEKATTAYEQAQWRTEIPSDESKRRRFDAGVEEVHQQQLAEKQRELDRVRTEQKPRVNDPHPKMNPGLF